MFGLSDLERRITRLEKIQKAMLEANCMHAVLRRQRGPRARGYSWTVITEEMLKDRLGEINKHDNFCTELKRVHEDIII